MKLFTTLFTITTLSIGHFAIGQEMPQLAGYMYNQFVYNPAAGGMYEADLNINSSARIQWSGVDGAPITNYTWADYRFSKNSMAVGANFMYDKIGARSFTDFALNYSYILRLNSKLKFSMGLRAGITSARFNSGELLRVDNAGDPLIVNSISTIYPKFGLGFQLYNRQFYLGLGVPDLLSFNSAYGADKDRNLFAKNRNFVVSGGYRLKLSDAFGLYPNAKIYYFPANAPRIDVSALLEITDYFWAGINVASIGSAALMAGTYISSRVRFMYAYEFMLQSQVSNAPLNVHEISLMLQFDELLAKRKKAVVAE